MALPSVSDLSTMGYVSRSIGYIDIPVSGAVSLDSTGYVSRGLAFTTNSFGSFIKTINGLARASVKTINGLTISAVKTWNGLA